MSTERDVTEADGWFVGEDKQFVFSIKDALGNVADITGWQMRWYLTDTKFGAPILTKTVAITNAASGVCTATVQSADTIAMTPATYYYDLRRIDSGTRAELAFGSAVLLDTWTDP